MGRSLEEIDLIFRDSPSVWATVRFARNRPIESIPDIPQDTREKGEVEHEEYSARSFSE
jgi:hypothetical protein